MTVYGYARVSTAEQDLTVQLDALKAAGCETIRSEKVSGTTTKGRTELAILREFMKHGDTLVVTRIDRLARSIGDLQDIVRSLKDNGIALRATEQPIDTSTAAGKAFLDMLGVFAEFETNLRRERQLEGIAQAKSRGVYKGRKPSIDRAKVLELHATGLGPTEIAEELRIGRASVYRVLDTETARVDRDEHDPLSDEALQKRAGKNAKSSAEGIVAKTDPLSDLTYSRRRAAKATMPTDPNYDPLQEAPGFDEIDRLILNMGDKQSKKPDG